MQIVKCNKCGKIMKEKKGKRDEWIRGHIEGGGISFMYFDLCEKCGKGLASYLKKYLKIKK